VSDNPHSDIVRTFDHPTWVNVDGRLGIVFCSSGATVYHNRHHFPTWWATADDLTLCRQEKSRKVPSGKVIAELAALITPGQSAKKTAATTLVELSGSKDCVGLIGGGHLAVANFGPAEIRAKLQTNRAAMKSVPIFEGTTQITGSHGYLSANPPNRPIQAVQGPSQFRSHWRNRSHRHIHLDHCAKQRQRHRHNHERTQGDETARGTIDQTFLINITHGQVHH